MEPFLVIFSAFVVSALSGLAALLRSGVQLTWLGVISAVLNSGLLGLGIALFWYNSYRDNVFCLVGICLLSGLGGMATVDYVMDSFRKGGLALKKGLEQNEEKKP